MWDPYEMLWFSVSNRSIKALSITPEHVIHEKMWRTVFVESLAGSLLNFVSVQIFELLLLRELTIQKKLHHAYGRKEIEKNTIKQITIYF